MRNRSVKDKFLSTLTDTGKAGARRVFRLFDNIESATKKDLSELDTDTIKKALVSKGSISKHTISNDMNYIRRYVRWCEENTILNVNKDILNIRSKEIYGTSSNKDVMIGSPRHLQQFLDDVFLPIDFGGADVIFRCFYWMLYGGLLNDEAVEVRKSQVDLIKMQIEYGNKTIPIYREAVEAFYFALTSTTINIKGTSRSGSPFIKHWKRAESEYLLSGTVSKYSRRSIESLASMAKIRNAEPGWNPVRFRTVWLCGMFYRICENEKLGLPPDFSPILSAYVDDGYLSRSDSEINRSKVVFLENNLKKMYASWKATYNN